MNSNTKTTISHHEPKSFSFSRRYFINWRKKMVLGGDSEDDDEEVLTYNSSSHFPYDREGFSVYGGDHNEFGLVRRKNNLSVSAKLRSAFTVFRKCHAGPHSGLGTKVIGTLFGYRRGHVHFAFQEDAKLSPAFLIELATPTSILLREMASGIVRIALECEKKPGDKKRAKSLIDEEIWRTYCNGKKYGYGMRLECGVDEWKVLKALEPMSMGAGVLPGNGDSGSELGDVMFMRAKFERVAGSKNSEAFYMMNCSDGSGGPELTVYLLRV